MVPAVFAATLTRLRAHSSAGERPLHTREVPGSIPGATTYAIAARRRSRFSGSTTDFPLDPGADPGVRGGLTRIGRLKAITTGPLGTLAGMIETPQGFIRTKRTGHDGVERIVFIGYVAEATP